MFRALAATASDAVLICDLVGTIEYASQAVTRVRLRPGGAHREATRRYRAPGGPAGRDQGRDYRAAGRGRDGQVRRAGQGSRRLVAVRRVHHLALRRGGSKPARLLITSRDVSDRVALRRAAHPADVPRRAHRAAEPGLRRGPGQGPGLGEERVPGGAADAAGRARNRGARTRSAEAGRRPRSWSTSTGTRP